MTMPILQGKLRGKKWIIGSSNIECALGSYEYEKRILFEKIISKSMVVYDIGANVGFYTLLASELVGKSGKVIAFEPMPGNLKCLRKHLEINKCTNVMVIDAAVSDKCGTVRFSEGQNNSVGHISENGNLAFNAVSIDTLIRDEIIAPPNCIKMDIEGAELLALKGAKSMLINYNPNILLATHSPELHISCCDFLISLGYKLKALCGDDLNNTDEIFAYK